MKKIYRGIIMKKLTRIVLILGMFAVFQGCNDLLDNPQPSTSISQEIALSDEGAVRAVRASMYSRLHHFVFTTLAMLGPDALADNLFNATGTSRFQGLAQNQLRAGLNDGGTGETTWEQVYDLINDANLIIAGIEEGTLESAVLQRYQGEAYALRAYAMHYLVRILGYEPGMAPASGQGAGFDLGIIVRIEPTTDLSDADQRARSTVAEVYTQIESDLTQAIDLLDNGNGVNFINEAFAQAILARVYLYQQKYAEADQMAQNAINSGFATLVTSAQVATMFDETVGANPESYFTVLIDPNTEGLGVNNALNPYTSNQWNAQVPTQDLRDLYEAGDARNDWFAPCLIDVDGSDCSTAAPTGEEIQKWNGEKGLFTDDVPLIRIAELKLIQAEARANTGGVTLNALAPLNEVRSNRNASTYTIADFAVGGSAALINEILDERRRELVAEGHRFFDLKRLGRDIRKAPGTGQPTIPYESLKVLDDIDPAEIEVNEQLVQNPGY